VVTLGLFEYRETSISPYNEVGVAIFVYPERYGHSRSLAGWAKLLKRPDRRDQGLNVIDLPVTTPDACAAGKEIWGYPKFVTPISFDLRAGKFSSVIRDAGDGPDIMELSGSVGSSFPVPPVPLVLHSHLDGVMQRAHVDVRNGMRVHSPLGLRLQVGPSRHGMAQNLRNLGLDGVRPIGVASTNRFQSRLNAGVTVGPQACPSPPPRSRRVQSC
jgi:hypothetical protein